MYKGLQEDIQRNHPDDSNERLRQNIHIAIASSIMGALDKMVAREPVSQQLQHTNVMSNVARASASARI